MHAGVLEHVDLYGLTTLTAVSRVVFQGDRRAARTNIDALVRQGHMFRHDHVLTRQPRAPKHADRWRDLAMLSYCCLGNHLRPRIPHDRLRATLDGPAAQLGLRPQAAKPCIFDRNDRLARLWVEPYTADDGGKPLGHVLAALQRATRTKSFSLWAYLALSGEFTMLVLCRHRARADELGRWLARAPLVGQAGSESLEIPVAVAAIQ